MHKSLVQFQLQASCESRMNETQTSTSAAVDVPGLGPRLETVTSK